MPSATYADKTSCLWLQMTASAHPLGPVFVSGCGWFSLPLVPEQNLLILRSVLLLREAYTGFFPFLSSHDQPPKKALKRGRAGSLWFDRISSWKVLRKTFKGSYDAVLCL